MRRAMLWALLLIGGGAGHVGAQANSQANTRANVEDAKAALRAEVEVNNRAMEAAVNRGDFLGAAKFYTDDAVVRTARSVVAQGRAAIDRYFQSLAPAKSWKLEVRDVGGPSDMPWQAGRSTLIHGARPDTSVVDFLVIWQRQKDGQLRILLDYYH